MRAVRVIASVCGLLLAAGLAYSAAASRQDRVQRDIVELCGSRVRIVWCQEAGGDGRDVGAEGDRLLLMGLDTADRLGVHPLLPRSGNYHKPLLTPAGDRVVFTDYPRAKICVVNWNGTSLRELSDGFALDVWLDPATRREWVYAVDSRTLNDGGGQPVIRFPLDNPFKREPVWKATPVTLDSFQVSADGTKAGALFPWPHAGVADLPAGAWVERGVGCWPDLSPDNRGLLWVFDGAHRNLVFHPADGRERWKVRINGAPGVDGYEVYHPRWSNQIRFMAMTGPYRSGEGDNRIRAGGRGVEIYLGRFSPDLRSVEAWVAVTHNECGDFYPDAWIEPAAGREASRSVTLGPAPTGAVSGAMTSNAAERVVVRARLTGISATPTLDAIAPYRHALVVYAYAVEQVLTGAYPHVELRVAHWGLIDGKAQSVPRRKGRTYELTVEPLDAHRELEGVRVMMDMTGDDLPLYYEAGR